MVKNFRPLILQVKEGLSSLIAFDVVKIQSNEISKYELFLRNSLLVI